MKTEEQIKKEIKTLALQGEPIKDSNPVATDKITQRLVALMWVLDMKKAPKSLKFNDTDLAILGALF